MTDELPGIDPGETDMFLIAQAARTHAQRASEKATSVETELNNLREHIWTKKEHDDFWEGAQAENTKQRHRLTVLLTFSAIALIIMVLLVWWFFWHLDTVDETTERRINDITLVAGQSCEQSNEQLRNTRELYETLAAATASPDVAAALSRAAESLPELVDCSIFVTTVPKANE